MNNFDDPRETEFTAKPFARARRAAVPGVGVVLRIETKPGSTQPPADDPSTFQVVLSPEQARMLARGLLHSATQIDS